MHAFGHLVQIRIRYGGAAGTGSVPFQMPADVVVALAGVCGDRSTDDSCSFCQQPSTKRWSTWQTAMYHLARAACSSP